MIQQGAVKRGAVLSMVGGMIMAMWAMIALAASGDGFWAPLDLIAHTIWSGAPLDGSFHARATLIGIVAHLRTSVTVGITITALTGRSASRIVAAAMTVSLGAWLEAANVWPALDTVAAALFPTWTLAIGHLMFGAAVTLGVAPSRRHPQHALAG
ncbi:MAG: hypothetical protein ACKVWR_07115 [Acidimicrobiales bacterium]